MNCSRFRHFIQQRFDMDLPAQDERMLSAHLETCESCAKFHHQIQQVLMAADDVQLPDEMVPPQPESLARAIMEHLPQPKTSPFAFLLNMFGGGKPKQPKEPKAAKPGKAKKQQKAAPEAVETASRFPHRTGPMTMPQEEETEVMSGPPPSIAGARGSSQQQKREQGEDTSGTATRLKAIAKGFAEPLTQDSRDAQSTTRSLGEKFGMAPSSVNVDDQPLTLAESIRRKIAESQKTATGEHQAVEVPPTSELAPQDDQQWVKPPSLPTRQPVNQPTGLPAASQSNDVVNLAGDQGPSVLGAWGRPSPIDATAWGQGGGGGGGGAPPAKAAGGGGGGSPWDSPPQAPQGKEASSVQQQQESGTSWGRSWADAPPRGAEGTTDSDWGPPPKGGTWDEPQEHAPPQSIPFTPPTPAPKPAPPPPIPAASDSTAPPAAQNSAWGQGANQGGQAPWQQQQQPSAAPSQDNWGAQPSWGQANQSAQVQPATPQPPQPAQPQAQAKTDGWASPQSGGQGGWGAAPQGGSWGQPVPDSWGKPQAEPPAQNNEPPQTPPQPQPPAAWGQPQQASPSAQAWAPAGSSWPQAGAAGAQPPAPAPIQPQQQQSQTGGWGQPAQGGWQMPSNAPAATSPVAPIAPPEDAPKQAQGKKWTADPTDQIETGTWRAFSPGTEGLGAKVPQAQPPQEAPDRWDAPIQARNKEPEAQRWDVPIQERGGQAQAPAQDASAWGAQPQQTQQPAAQAPQAQSSWGAAQPQQADAGAWGGQPQAASPQPAGGLPRESIMDRLSSVLSEGQGNAMGGASTQSRWDVPIQERGGSPQQAAQPPADGRWDMPIQDRTKAGEQSPELSPPPPRWDQGVQERTQPLSQLPQNYGQDASTAPWGSLNQTDTSAQAWGQPQQQQQAQPEPIPSPAPFSSSPLQASAEITSSSWDLPLVEQKDQLHHVGEVEAPQAPFAPPQPAAAFQPPPQQPFAPPVPPVQADNKGGLFHLDDNAIDRIFTEHLGINDAGSGSGAPAQAPPQSSQPTIMKSMPTAPAAQPAAPPPVQMPVQQNMPATPPPLPGAANWGAPQTPAAPQPQPFAQPAAQQPAAFGQPASFGTPPAQTESEGNSGAPKIVPVMSKNSGTASGGVPTSKPQPAPPAWSAPSPAPSNGPSPAPVFQAPAQAPPPQPVAAQNKAAGLFNLDDTAMDDLFSKNLGVTEAATPVGGAQNAPNQQQPQPAFASIPQPAAVAAPQPQPSPFMSMPQVPPAQPLPQVPPMPQVAPPSQQVQHFGAPPAMPNIPTPPPLPMPVTSPPSLPTQPPALPPLGQGAPPQQPQGGALFNVDDNLMNKIFADNLGVQEDPNAQPKVNVTEAVKALSDAVATPIGGPAPKIEGLGRLDPKTDGSGDSGSGRIASIGKFLLDQKDLEKIGKLTASDLSDTKMKILTLEAASEIQSLLHHIGGQQGVVGSIIIGHDGLLIANTMPGDVEADSIGIWALAVYMNTETAIKKIGHDRVHQIVSKTPRGYLVIADFGGGLLVTLSDGKDTDALIPLMRSITQVVSQ